MCEIRGTRKTAKARREVNGKIQALLCRLWEKGRQKPEMGMQCCQLQPARRPTKGKTTRGNSEPCNMVKMQLSEQHI